MEQYKELRNTDDVSSVLDFSDNALMDTMKCIEQGHWDYIDNYSSKNRRLYPKLNFYQYLIKTMNACGIDDCNAKQYCRAYDKHKKSIPTGGAAIVYQDMILLVKIYGGHVFSMPKGKSEKGETIRQTAIREVQEETGLDLKSIIMDGNLDELYIHKTMFYVVQSDFKIKSFTGYNNNEVRDIQWFNKEEIIANPNKFSKQSRAVVKKLIDMNLL